MSIPGDWVLNYDWGFTGHYLQGALGLNADGTCEVGPDPKTRGGWMLHNGQILIQFQDSEFDGFRPTYSGVVEGNAMVVAPDPGPL